MADTSDSSRPEELDSAIATIESRKDALGDPVKVGRVLSALYIRKRNVPKAEEALKGAVAAAPNSAEARMSLATLHQAKGEVQQAETEFKAAVEADPKEPAGKLRLADFYLQQRKVGDAKRVLGEIVASHPDYTPALLRTAEIALAERRLDDSLKALEPVLKKNADDRTGLLLMGMVQLGKGQPNDSIQTFQKVLKSNPKFTPARYQLALAYIQAGNVEQAKSELREIVETSRKEKKIPNADAVFLLADLNIKQGATDVAIEDLKAFIDLLPKVPRAYELLGAAYLRKNEPAKATESYRRILALSPDDPRGKYLVAYRASGRGQAGGGAQAFRGGAGGGPEGDRTPGSARGPGPGRKEARCRTRAGQEADREVAGHRGPLLRPRRRPPGRGELDQAVAAHKKAIELDPQAVRLVPRAGPDLRSATENRRGARGARPGG